MTKKTFAWIFAGGSLMTSAALALVACSDATTVTPVPSVDASKPDTSIGTDSSTPDSSSPPQDAGADCAKTPNFHATPEAGPFCPFQKAADGGALFGDCNLGDHCCLYSQNSGLPSTCNAAATGCTADAGTSDFQCEETSDCAGAGMVCCLIGTVAKDPACGSYFGSKVNGTACRQGSCGAGEAQVCDGAQAACPAGQTCHPLKTKSIELGACTAL